MASLFLPLGDSLETINLTILQKNGCPVICITKGNPTGKILKLVTESKYCFHKKQKYSRTGSLTLTPTSYRTVADIFFTPIMFKDEGEK